MTVAEAIAINTLLRSLANEDGVSWEEMASAGEFLADRAFKVLANGRCRTPIAMTRHTGASFRRALEAGQGDAGIIDAKRLPNCDRCNDGGAILGAARAEWCDCAAATKLRSKEPDFVERWNAREGSA